MDNIMNSPAFPLVYDGEKAESFCNNGMTLRDYFAAKAMQGLISTCIGQDRQHVHSIAECVILSYEYADAMLAERIKLNPLTKQ